MTLERSALAVTENNHRPSSYWQTKEQLLSLLTSLVRVPSITGSRDEGRMAHVILEKLRLLPYFQDYPEQLQMHRTEDGRPFVTALVKKREDVKNTVILLSHFDVVNVEEYGRWKDAAFSPQTLTQRFYRERGKMQPEVRKDVEAGSWLFGRGTMDMKCGVALHMSMVEKAALGEFDGNVLMLTVCDEEGVSAGMRAAVPVLHRLGQSFQLAYKACLNSEPIFPRRPGDEGKYVYTGSIGKMNLGYFCFGKEAHVGEPFSGMNANLMASVLVQEMELSADLVDVIEEEKTPPPTNLIYMQLKDAYSVTVPYRTALLFNLFYMEKSMADIVRYLHQHTEHIARRIDAYYLKRADEMNYAQYRKKHIRVLSYRELEQHIRLTKAKGKRQEIFDRIKEYEEEADEREMTMRLIDQMAHEAKELWPMIVIFFAPPFNPAVSSADHPLIQRVVRELMRHAKEKHDLTFKSLKYFPGVSDLSYTGLTQPAASFNDLISNMPLWEKGYTIPFEQMAAFDFPVLNLGPVGKDAHKWTERLNADFAFGPLTDLMGFTIQRLLR